MTRNWAWIAGTMLVFLFVFWSLERFFGWVFAIPVSFVLAMAGIRWLFLLFLRRRQSLADKESHEFSGIPVALLVVFIALTMARRLRSDDWNAHRGSMREWAVASASLYKLKYSLSRHPDIQSGTARIVNAKGTWYRVSGRTARDASVDALEQDLKELELPFRLFVDIYVAEVNATRTDHQSDTRDWIVDYSPPVVMRRTRIPN